MVEFDIVELPERPTAVVSGLVAVADLPGFLAEAYGRVAAEVERQGMVAAPEPFCLYREMSEDSVAVEAGFPVDRPIRPGGGVETGMLPAGRAAVALHVGAYDALDVTYHEVEREVTRRGFELGDIMWEIYMSDPEKEPDPATWRTTIVWPLAG